MSIDNIKVSAEGKTIDALIVSVDGRRGRQQKGTLPLVPGPAAEEPIREENQIALQVSELSTKHAPLSAEMLQGLGEAKVEEPPKQLHEIRKAKGLVLENM